MVLSIYGEIYQLVMEIFYPLIDTDARSVRGKHPLVGILHSACSIKVDLIRMTQRARSGGKDLDIHFLLKLENCTGLYSAPSSCIRSFNSSNVDCGHSEVDQPTQTIRCKIPGLSRVKWEVVPSNAQQLHLAPVVLASLVESHVS